MIFSSVFQVTILYLSADVKNSVFNTSLQGTNEHHIASQIELTIYILREMNVRSNKLLLLGLISLFVISSIETIFYTGS